MGKERQTLWKMVKKSNLAVKPFLTRVTAPRQIVSQEVLWGCVNGLTKRIKLCRTKEKRSKLKMIRSEIQSLLDNL